LHEIPFLVSLQQESKDTLKQLIESTVNYLLSVKLEQQKGSETQERVLELAAYMSCFQVETAHKLLFLKNAMGMAYKSKCFVYSAFFAKKIINLMQVISSISRMDCRMSC
jgi:hypothetical protein